jgi:hypothetical protein
MYRLTKLFSFVLVWGVASLALAQSSGTSLISGDLQGLDKINSTNWSPSSPWSSVNLQGWRELDLIPVRVELFGGLASNQLVSVSFPHFKSGIPGFQNLFFISNSPSLFFTEPPTLVAVHGQGGEEDWSYAFRVTVTDSNTAYVYLYARLAAGAHLNTGSSLQLSGEPSLSPLQIH